MCRLESASCYGSPKNNRWGRHRGRRRICISCIVSEPIWLVGGGGASPVGCWRGKKPPPAYADHGPRKTATKSVCYSSSTLSTDVYDVGSPGRTVRARTPILTNSIRSKDRFIRKLSFHNCGCIFVQRISLYSASMHLLVNLIVKSININNLLGDYFRYKKF